MNKPIEPVHLTAAAQQQIRAIVREKGIPEFYSLRIGLRGASCGASYLLGFDTRAEADELYDVAGISILIDRCHLMHVLGLAIDFEDGEEGAGFTFNKPNIS
ncbi:MAG: iron-sulfur cluster assembly accessory protein [Cytophagaceae bacterium]|nr:iron-sulfur cluster assembly accessory protein [Cytophagaceae bacterium]